MKATLKRLSVAFSLLFLAGQALAAEPVSSEEIKSLYSGRVAEGVTGKSIPVTVTYLPDGRLEGRRVYNNNKLDLGKWWVPSDGTLCIRWNKWRKKQEICNQIEKEGDTVYRIDRKGRRQDDLNGWL
jgi:hypothetical protein